MVQQCAYLKHFNWCRHAQNMCARQNEYKTSTRAIWRLGQVVCNCYAEKRVIGSKSPRMAKTRQMDMFLKEIIIGILDSERYQNQVPKILSVTRVGFQNCGRAFKVHEMLPDEQYKDSKSNSHLSISVFGNNCAMSRGHLYHRTRFCNHSRYRSASLEANVL